MRPIFSNPAALFSGRESGRLRGAELCPDGCSHRPPARLTDESKHWRSQCSNQTRSRGERRENGIGMISEGGEKTGMHQRKTAKQISGGRPPCLHQRGAVTATTPHKYLTVIFKLQNTESPASDKNTYSWNYQRNAKSRPSSPPSLLSLSKKSGTVS
ncbi:hypothetical protein PO909_025623 [Leuciscus waleckii]